jgi:Icc-related predicted phosphoesterase
MKIRVLSDLHLEFGALELSDINYDIAILAGDIHIKDKAIEWIQSTIPNKPVLYVLGNHEFYGEAYPKLITELKDNTKNSNIHILENDLVTIDGVNFLGATLWTDFKAFGDPRIAGPYCQQIMSDFKTIRLSPNYSKLRPIDLANIHSQSLKWLENKLKEHKGEKNIVITHHGPSKKSVLERYMDDLSTAAFVSNLDSFILEHNPDYWIHGHLHNSVDYTIGSCRVICNPRGYYPSDLNQDFDEKCILSI